MIRTALALSLLALAACDNSMATETPDVFGYADRSSLDEAGDRDLVQLGLSPSGVKGGQTYAEFDAARDLAADDSFHGFGCLESCDGHEAGWRWAEDNGIGDPVDCGGNSWSFEEGCVAYAAEQLERPDDEGPDLGLL